MFYSQYLLIIAIILIIIIFLISGNQELLDSMLQGTVKGEISGLTIFAVGPFAIWLGTFIVISLSKEPPIKRIKLMIDFADDIHGTPPTKRVELQKTICLYTILDSNQPITDEQKVPIRFDDLGSGRSSPFIFVDVRSVVNPMSELKLRYKNDEWLGDSYSIKRGRVKFR
jgi:hypothetical protein